MRTTKYLPTIVSFTIVIAQLLSSCSTTDNVISSSVFQKRKYNNGYHINVFSKKLKVKTKSYNKDNETSIALSCLSTSKDEFETPKIEPQDISSDDMLAYTNKDGGSRIEKNNLFTSTQEVIRIIPTQEVHIPSISNKAIYKKENDCAEIIMRNGDIIKGQVIKIGVSEIEYKKCEHLNGPIYSLMKADVLMIIYANGVKDVFKEEEPKAVEPKHPTYAQEVIHHFPDKKINKKTVDGLGIAGFTIGLISTLFLIFLSLTTGGFIATIITSLLAIIFGSAGVSRVTNNPDTYMGKGFGITAFLLGLVVIMLWLTVVLPLVF